LLDATKLNMNRGKLRRAEMLFAEVEQEEMQRGNHMKAASAEEMRASVLELLGDQEQARISKENAALFYGIAGRSCMMEVNFKEAQAAFLKQCELLKALGDEDGAQEAARKAVEAEERSRAR
jgi:hypothetical protein